MRRWFREELGAFVMLSPVPWKRFIAREGLILMGFIGLGLIIAYICFRAGGLYFTDGFEVNWKTYESKFFGRPIYVFKAESSVPPDMDWFHFFFPFPGIDPGYRNFKQRIEEKTRWIRKIQHRFVLNKPFVPPDREWVYFFAVEEKRRNILLDEALGYLPDFSTHITASIERHSVLLIYREIPGSKLGLFLSPQERDEKNSMKINDVGVVIRKPRKFYPFYVRHYLRKYLILPYAGFWYIRLIVLSVIQVIQLRRRDVSPHFPYLNQYFKMKLSIQR